MFKKKPSFRASKDFTPTTTSSSPEPAAAAAAAAAVAPAVVVPEPKPPAPVKKAEVPKPKPSGPPSIVPAGTKRVLVVGKSVVMTADVENCDAVIVQGNLDGNIVAKYVVIMKGGCMRGTVVCEEADVAGSFEGVEMTIHHRLTLSGTARVGGKTTYHRLSVHDGAILTGELQYKPSLRDGPAMPPPPAAKGEEESASASSKPAVASSKTAAVDAVPLEATSDAASAVASETCPEKTTAATKSPSKQQ